MSDPTTPSAPDPALSSIRRLVNADRTATGSGPRPLLLLSPDLRIDARPEVSDGPLTLTPQDRVSDDLTDNDGAGSGAAERPTDAQADDPAARLRHAVRDPRSADGGDRRDDRFDAARDRQIAALKAAVTASHAAQANDTRSASRLDRPKFWDPAWIDGTTAESSEAANDTGEPEDAPRFTHHHRGAGESTGTGSLERRDGARDSAGLPATLSDDALRDLVSDIVREELSGALGQQVSGNIRKLVRREVARHLSMRDAE